MVFPLIRYSIYKPAIVVAFAFLLLVYCGWKLFNTSLDIFPEFSPKLVVVQTEAPGMSTEQVELLISRPIESLLNGIPEVMHVRSESIAGLSVITITFMDNSNRTENSQMVLEKLNGVSSILPESSMHPKIMPLSSSAATIMTIGFTSNEKSLLEVRSIIENNVSPTLLSTEGVADLNIFGGYEKRLEILLKENIFKKTDLTIRDILSALNSVNLTVTGNIITTNQEINVISEKNVSIEKIESILVKSKNGKSWKLNEIASIKFSKSKQINKASIETEKGVLLMVIGQLNADTVAVTKRLDMVINELRPLLENNNIQIHSDIFRPANYILTSLHSIIDHLAMGGILVLFILIIFMANIKAALISALAIPISLTLAAILTLLTGTSLNIMVIGGLAIALGEVVDDAIIDVENILRRLRENRALAKPVNSLKVIYRSSLEVRGSVIYASLIVMLVFVPLLMLSGVVGRMFAPLGIAYILAIFSSLISALTITPALSSLGFRNLKQTKDPLIIRILSPIYEKMIYTISLNPKFNSILALLFCCLGLLLVPKLNIGFLPELREGHYMIHTSSLTGTSLEETMRIGDHITEKVLAIEGVKTMSQWAGRAERGADTFGSHYSEFEVELNHLSGKEQQNIYDEMRNILHRTPGITFEANSFLIERVDETSSGFTSPIVIQLFGNNLDELDKVANQLFLKLKQSNLLTDIQIKSVLGKPQIEIEPKLDKLDLYNISLEEFYSVINASLDGIIIGDFYHNSIKIPMVLTLIDNNFKSHITNIENIEIRGIDNKLVKLKDLAKITIGQGRYNIYHDAGRRVQIITADVIGNTTELGIKEITDIINKEKFDSSVYVKIVGTAVEGAEARKELIIISFIVLIGILFLVFIAINNVKNTFLILVNLPFALVGGLIAAFFTGGLLSIGSIVGFVTLFGITLRNSIMLVSHYQRLVFIEGEFWNQHTAIKGAKERLPSILMTGLVTGLAMLPIALDADNPGREIMGPMAAIIIGGLTSSTILNLFILPAFMLAFGSFVKRS